MACCRRNYQKEMKLGIYTAIMVQGFTRRSRDPRCKTGVTMAARKRAKRRTLRAVNELRIPAQLQEAIEIQRGRLATAESVLGCLVNAMEYETDSLNRPYYPDVAELARELVKQSINGLDSLVLQKHLLRNKIREYLGPPAVEGAYRICYH